MGERESSKMGESEKQNRKKKKQILSRPSNNRLHIYVSKSQLTHLELSYNSECKLYGILKYLKYKISSSPNLFSGQRLLNSSQWCLG